jgi:hypothetical protein
MAVRSPLACRRPERSEKSRKLRGSRSFYWVINEIV